MGETPRRGRAAHRAHRQDRRRRSDQELLLSLQEPPHRRCPPAANQHPHHRPPAAGYWTCGRAHPSPRRARGRSGIPRFPGREAPVTLPQACAWRETYRRSGASTPLRISFAFSWELIRAKLVPAPSPVGHAKMREMPPPAAGDQSRWHPRCRHLRAVQRMASGGAWWSAPCDRFPLVPNLRSGRSTGLHPPSASRGGPNFGLAAPEAVSAGSRPVHAPP
jgi:hypothetical protein